MKWLEIISNNNNRTKITPKLNSLLFSHPVYKNYLRFTVLFCHFAILYKRPGSFVSRKVQTQYRWQFRTDEHNLNKRHDGNLQMLQDTNKFVLYQRLLEIIKYVRI